MKAILLALFFVYAPASFGDTGHAAPAVQAAPNTPSGDSLPKGTHIAVDSVPALEVDLKSETNWYLILLPIVTIAIVLASMVITLRTLKLNADNTKAAFRDTIQSQQEISEREIKTKVLAENRQKWINELRNDLAEFAASLHHLSMYIMISGKEKANPEFAEFIAKAELKQAKINLMINPTEPDHKELVQTIGEAMQSAYTTDGDIYPPLRKLTEISQAILKREWERVKKLD